MQGLCGGVPPPAWPGPFSGPTGAIFPWLSCGKLCKRPFRQAGHGHHRVRCRSVDRRCIALGDGTDKMNSGKPGYRRIDRCRISGSRNLVSVLDLGHQQLTGVFPKSRDENITSGPLELLWCPDSGLLQLAHSYEAQEFYGENYGYRSGLNQSMVDHLGRKIGQLSRRADLKPGDTVL